MKKIIALLIVSLVLTLNVFGQYNEAEFANFMKQAQAGDVRAQNQVGICYYNGWGCRLDYVQAVKWLSKSAEQGNKHAQNTLGLCYLNGQGVGKNPYVAVSWFTKSANQGHAKAQSNLANCYRNGWGVDKNISIAIEWYKKAAAQGHEKAKQRLAELGGSIDDISTTMTLLSSAYSSTTSYDMRVGVKSPSHITNYSVFINGSLIRGIGVVNNNGFDIEINKNVTLQNGNNTIRLEIVNQSGTAHQEFDVYVEGGNYNNTSTEKRVALVIGNSNYKNAPLRNPVNDATDIAAKLKILGFDVTLKVDLTHSGFESTLKNFKYKASGSDIALLYYAGHGMEIDGFNYLIPTDAPIDDDEQLKYKSVNANFALDVISGAKKKIIILDACRNNPSSRSVMHGGLGVMSATNAFFAYSTSPGKTASDGNGRNSPYTTALLQALDIKNQTLPQLFQKVSQIVTAKNHLQIPWTSSSLVEDVILNK